MSIPVIALVGRPNVGKSTLFNCLTKRRDALVLNQPGVTRDRQFGLAKIGDKPFKVIDTGGIGEGQDDMDIETGKQSWQGIDEADSVIFMVDAKQGLTAVDKSLFNKLRRFNKPVALAINKTDGLDERMVMLDFYEIGAEKMYPIAAAHNRGIIKMVDDLSELFVEEEAPQEEEGIRVAIIGRPNVGKSTLVNRLIGEERCVVFDEPGTTRDSIQIRHERHGQEYTFVDTAGMRRKSRIIETLEKFSIIKTKGAIAKANVVIMVIDSQEGVTDQDLTLLRIAHEMGRAIIIAFNKWDNLDIEQKEEIQKNRYRLDFVYYAKHHYISAKFGSGVGNLYGSVDEVYASATKELPTAPLNQLILDLAQRHPPPLIRGRRIKMRYVNCIGHCPPRILIHGNQVQHLPEGYKRYLIKHILKHFKLVGTPVHLEVRRSTNPFAGRKNVLTPSQLKKRHRLMKFNKKRKK